MGYFEKLAEYYKSDKAEQDNKRFIKQVKNSYISTAIIIGVLFLLIVILMIISGIQSLFN
jgi:uncharacterized integral membrane protein